LGYVGADRRLLVANAAAARWLGASAAALRGRHVREVLGERNYEQVRPSIDAVLSGRPQTFECAFTIRGVLHHAQASLTPHMSRGQVVGFYVSVAEHGVTSKASALSRSPQAREVGEIQGVLIEGLTNRELRVLELLPTYRSTTDIAEALHVSVNTVKTHVKAIYRKLGVNSRREAIARGIAADLLPDHLS